MSDHTMPATAPSADPCLNDCNARQVHDGLAFLSAEAARLDRRGFLTQTMVAAAALALAACGDSGSITDAPTSVGASIKVADYSALATVGGVALVTLNGAALAVVRTGTSTFVALSRRCPHEGATVNATSSGFTCPRHGARFSSTGTWLGGERTSSMRSYTTTYDATAGTLTIG